MSQGSDESPPGTQKAVQRVIDSRDETEMLFHALARDHNLPSAAMVCKTWAVTASGLVDAWQQKLCDDLIVCETAVSSTHGQGISFYHPPSASFLVVNGMELLHRITQTRIRDPGSGTVVKGTVSPSNFRSSMVGRIEQVGDATFAVWQETVQVRIVQEILLPWMTVKATEQRRQLRMTSHGLAWDGPSVELPNRDVVWFTHVDYH